MKKTPLIPDLGRHHREAACYIRNYKFEFMPDGVLIPAMSIGWRGEFSIYHNGELVETAKNLLTTEGRNHILSVVFAAGTQVTTWYMAPYSNATDPVITWTAANFNANANEETNYTQATRPAWDEATPASGVLGTTTRGTITADTGGIAAINGTGLLSSSVKGGTSGTLVSAVRYSAAVAVPQGDSYDLGYQVTLIDTSEV